MKGLSLTQPWASLVACGLKRIETRSWPTSYRGPIAVHAAKGFPRWAREFAQEQLEQHRLCAAPSLLPLGAIVAVATVVDCRRTEDVVGTLTLTEEELGDYAPGRFAWFLADVVALEVAVPCRGALGLWTVPPEIGIAMWAARPDAWVRR